MLRPDFASRALSVVLGRIEHRTPRRKLWKQFTQEHPAILGALVDVVSAMLKRLPEIEAQELDLPRMADAAESITAAELALGWEPNSFVGLCDQYQDEMLLDAVDSDPLAITILRLMRDGPGYGKRRETWEGHWGELLTELNCMEQPHSADRRWPRTGQGLASHYRYIEAALRKAGIEATRSRDTRNNVVVKLVWTIPGEELPFPVKPTPGCVEDPGF